MTKPDSKFSLDSFSPEAAGIINKAQKFADESKCRLCDPAHLLAVLVDMPDITTFIKESGINTVTLIAQLHNYLSAVKKGADTSSLSPETIEVISRARDNARTENRPANTMDLLYSVTQERRGIVGELCSQHSLTSNLVKERLDSGKDRDITASPYLTNLSALAKDRKIDPVVGRDDEVRRLVQILGRRSKQHPILVGEHGVGKRTIVLALVNRIAHGHVPRSMQNMTVVQLNTTNLLVGAKQKTDVEKRVDEALKSLRGHDAILYIRSVDTLVNSSAKLNMLDIYEKFWQHPGLRVIAATSPDGFKKLEENDANLVKELNVINVEPTSPEAAVEVLRGVAHRYENHHNIKIGETAIALAVKLAKRYVQDRFLPESAIDILDEAASNKMMGATGMPLELEKAMHRLSSIRAQLTGLHGDDDEASAKVRNTLETEARALTTIVESNSAQQEEMESEEEMVLADREIGEIVSQWTGIPLDSILANDAEKLTHMEEKLANRVVGQNEAITAISKAVRRSYLGLREPGKPIGSFWFGGSSGSGKTEICKALAEFLFNDETAIVRIDCAEFQEKHNISKLIGAPNGYEGAADGGILTEGVRKKPFSLVLFDEVEKGHPDMINVLLAVLEDSRLTDGKGRTVSFENTIIIFTSNIGAKRILNSKPDVFESPEKLAKLNEEIREEMLGQIRPELLNRIGMVCFFQPLSKETLGGIFDIQIRNLNKMLSSRDIKVSVSPEAKDQLIDISYEPAMGARPLKRAITSHVQDPVAEGMVKSLYPAGSQVCVDFTSDSFTLNVQ